MAATKKLRVGGIAVYVGSPAGPDGAIRIGDRVRIIRIIGSAARVIPARAPAGSKKAMRESFTREGIGVSDYFLIPESD